MLGLRTLALLTLLFARASAGAAPAMLPSPAPVVDSAGVLDGETFDTLRRLTAEAGAGLSGQARVSVVTFTPTQGEAIEAYALRLHEDWHIRDRRARNPADDRVLVVLDWTGRRAFIRQGAEVSTPLSAAQRYSFQRSVFEPALASDRPGPALVHGTVQLLIALGVDPGDVEDPHRTRSEPGALVRALLMVVGFFGYLTGLIIQVLREDARAKRPRAHGGAGLGAPESVGQAPFAKRVDELPIVRGVPRKRFIVAMVGFALPIAVLSVGGSMTWLTLGAWLGALGGWSWLCARAFRPPPLRSTIRDGDAVLVRPPRGALRATLAVFPLVGVLVVTFGCGSHVPDMAVVALVSAMCGLLLLASIAASCVSYRASPRGIDRVTFLLRRKTTLSWNEVNGVRIWTDDAGSSMNFCAGVTRLVRFAVPLSYEGAGDLAELVLQHVHADAISPDTRAQLQALADTRGSDAGTAAVR